ncbi:hypothetical protein HDU76_010209 [Blyttiomyces sp. JEL0837]|nr:hypothetical protein HDU76_010209 [Blyttiomyces sp. JEL0837]
MGFGLGLFHLNSKLFVFTATTTSITAFNPLLQRIPGYRMASSLTTHKSTVYLTFSPKCPPYAEVATYLVASKSGDKSSHAILKLGLQRDLCSTTPTIIIPPVKFSKDKTFLNGKSTIARFLSRLSQPTPSTLYDGLPFEGQALVDEMLDTCRSVGSGQAPSAEFMKKFSALTKNDKGALPSPLTIGHLLAWDILRQDKSTSGAAAAWVKKLEFELPELKQAVIQVDEVMASTHILDEYRFPIVEQVSKLTGVSRDLIFPMLENKYPKDPAGGDFSLAVPRLKLPGNPQQVAQDIAEKFVKDETIADVKASGVFLKFYIKWDLMRNRLIPKILSQNEKYGSNAEGFGKTAIVEFSSPNIAKPFHVGHLRSTIMGNFIQKTLDASGWTTVSINYLGDWGKQYGLLAVGYKKYGNEKALVDDPIRHLFDVYVKINREAEADATIHDQARAYFAKMEEGKCSKDELALWQRFMDLSIIKYREIYQRVNVDFDVYSGESKYSAKEMKGVVDKLKEMGLLVPSEGAQVVDLNAFKLGSAIIEKKDGGMLYISRDVAAAIDRYNKYQFDHMFYVVGKQQEHHFKQLFKILELLGMPWADKCQHIDFGMIKSKDGNMSTRKGTVVFLEDVLQNVQESMLEVMKKNEDMSSRRVKDYELDWDRMLAFEGDTGPYLQYAHARLCSIERNAGFTVDTSVNLATLTEAAAVDLIDVIAMYPDIVREAANSREPCNIVSYAFRLAHAVMVAFDNLYVQNQPPEIAAPRLAMFRSARITLGNALKCLGIKPLERM